MFNLKSPCANCPFRVGYGSSFRLSKSRLDEIYTAPAFQCHKTLKYNDEGLSSAGNKPQQCAGLMAVLNQERSPNTIMRLAVHTGHLDLQALDTRETYRSWLDVTRAHVEGIEPQKTIKP